MTMLRTPVAAAARMSLSSATRPARAGDGVNGVSSSKTSSRRSPPARVPTMLEPLVWMNGLPLPASALSIASAEARCSALAASTTASASRAASANTSASSSVPRTGAMPSLASASAVSAERARPAHLVAGSHQMRRHRAADIAAGAGDENLHVPRIVAQLAEF